MKLLATPEWGRITIGEGENAVSASLADALLVQAEAARRRLAKGDGAGPTVLTRDRSHLCAAQVTGILRTRDAQLEVLPKVDDDDRILARKTLMRMLARVWDLPVSANDLASIVSTGGDILEVLIRIFADELFSAVHRGLPHGYVEHEDDLPALRGRLDFTRQFTRLAATPQRLACRFDEFTPDIPINRVLKAAVRLLSRLSRHRDNQRKLHELLPAFDGVAELSTSAASQGTGVLLDRTNRAYHRLYDMAQRFLRSEHQSIYTGNGDGFALLFEMNTLFEEFIGRTIEQALRPKGWTVSLQRPQSTALIRESGIGAFRTKPDIHLVAPGSGSPIVIDTKWKQLTTGRSSPPWGVSSADVYQMMAYGQVYDAEAVILLYPHSGVVEKTPGILETFETPDRRHIVVATLDLTNLVVLPGQLSKLVEQAAFSQLVEA